MRHRFASSRRDCLTLGLALGASVMAPTSLHAALVATPRQTPGPFYPKLPPLDSDTDLVNVKGRSAPAAGQVLHVHGRVLDQDGAAVPGARVELWQCDAMGRYHHPLDGGGGDPNFQGYGAMDLGQDGAYRFRTIRPVPYPGRTPHIHFAVTGPGLERFTTQMYVAGDPRNERDGILRRVRDPAARARLLVELSEATDIEPDALVGQFDIVLDERFIRG